MRIYLHVFYKQNILTNISVRTKSALKLPGGRRGEFNHSPPSGAEVKNEWSDASPSPHMSSWRGDGNIYLYHYLQNNYNQ